jgi:hypothetical protein
MTAPDDSGSIIESKPFPAPPVVAVPMKWCLGCKKPAPKSDFSPHAKQRDGLQPRCRKCMNARAKQWRKDNQSKARAQRKRKGMRIALRRQNGNDYYGDRYRNNMRVRAQGLIGVAKRRAMACDLPFSLGVDLVEARLKAGKCEATGITLRMDAVERCWSPTIDRIKSSDGYTEANCRIVVFAYNAAKGSGTDADVLALAKAVMETSHGD